MQDHGTTSSGRGSRDYRVRSIEIETLQEEKRTTESHRSGIHITRFRPLVDRARAINIKQHIIDP